MFFREPCPFTKKKRAEKGFKNENERCFLGQTVCPKKT